MDLKVRCYTNEEDDRAVVLFLIVSPALTPRQLLLRRRREPHALGCWGSGGTRRMQGAGIPDGLPRVVR